MPRGLGRGVGDTATPDPSCMISNLGWTRGPLITANQHGRGQTVNGLGAVGEEIFATFWPWRGLKTSRCRWGDFPVGPEDQPTTPEICEGVSLLRQLRQELTRDIGTTFLFQLSIVAASNCFGDNGNPELWQHFKHQNPHRCTQRSSHRESREVDNKQYKFDGWRYRIRVTRLFSSCRRVARYEVLYVRNKL